MLCAVGALSTLICTYTGCPDTGYASVCANRLSLYAKVPIVGVCLSFGLILGMVAIQDGWHALANGCMLKMTRTVKDTQDGFAGTTGTVWMIEPDCTFRVSRLFGPHVAEPHLKGALTPEQQARLSAVLAKTAVSELPAQIGDATGECAPHYPAIWREGRRAVSGFWRPRPGCDPGGRSA